MREGSASHTARRVAAHRLDYERIAMPYGDPAADLALARDVADGERVEPSRMHEYLRARTAFFDRMVVTALEAGMEQIVVGGAGYDGRAYRYAKDGVRWFEVDHPATQADKLERVGRLGIEARHVRFVAADFEQAPVADLLVAAGLDPASPALFLLEGVAVYLDARVLERLLGQFRQVTTSGGKLAISVPRTEPRFAALVAAVGEPVRSTLTSDDALALLASQGWRVTEGRDQPRTAGLLLAEASTAVATPTAAEYRLRSRLPPEEMNH